MRFVAIVPKSILKDIYYERVDGTRVKMYDFRSVNGVITPYIKCHYLVGTPKKIG